MAKVNANKENIEFVRLCDELKIPVPKTIHRVEKEVQQERINGKKVLWHVVSPSGQIVRSYRDRNMAKKNANLFTKRAREMFLAKHKAQRSGEVVEIKRRGRSPIKVWIDPDIIIDRTI